MKRAKKSSTAQAVGRSGPTGCSALNNIPFEAGTIVMNKESGNVYTVVANYGDRAVAVRECSIMNPAEWEVVRVPVKPNNGRTCGETAAGSP